MSDRIVTFRGPVSCRRGAAPLGLTLVGETAEHPREPAELALSGAVPADSPAALQWAPRVFERGARGASAPRHRGALFPGDPAAARAAPQADLLESGARARREP